MADPTPAAAPVPLTYPEVGATRHGPLPGGYHHLRVRTPLGHGEAVFEAAAEALLDWRMHRGLGIGIAVDAERAVPGAEVAVRIGPVAGRCRVVWALRGPRRAGFAYGTLPGHPESGEEAFLVELAPGGAVRLTVTAFSRPDRWFTRLAGPLVLLFQRAYGRRCGRVLARLAAAGARPSGT
ncbi:hypothetical protein SLNWT_4637 [Streptomyces albus]|uniref:DUF1990 domain-containing protein n=1 Tax=Streptomyces albus (strain ATCC 21838 / DSM 41398 / FERM P-419 / JCM 4703 / NBRC 107858) TaxID=1081613 RepID=A0A0B5EQH1_STRA4|nr:hypothetical protein SLNWT_4637 [Streptomyces albus]AOU79319.1 hypothetical protein SLNHY_4628 [Streptomyces albus]